MRERERERFFEGIPFHFYVTVLSRVKSYTPRQCIDSRERQKFFEGILSIFTYRIV